MPSHSLPREFAFYVATSFDSSGGPADWSSNGTYCYATNIETENLVRATVPNENNRLTLRGFHPHILTRRVAGCAVSVYLHSNPTHAAEAAAATTFHLSTLAKSALGGEDLGYAIGIASSEAEDTDELEIDSDPGYAVGDWIFAYDTSGAVGQAYRITAIDAGPPVTLTLDRDRHFTPDTGGADVAHAVIDTFIDDSVTQDHANAGHTTLWMRFQGDHDEDVQTAKGCKPSLGQITIQAGVPMQMPLDVMVTTHSHETDTTEDFSAATINGSAGVVPGIADKTLVFLSQTGSALAAKDALGTITINPGVTYAASEGPNGWEGVHGYIDQGEDTTVELMVEFDADYATAFNAQTTYHLLIQIGTGTDAIFFYFPRLALDTYPPRVDEGNVTASKLTFRALKGTASTAGLSAANARKLNAPFHMGFVA